MNAETIGKIFENIDKLTKDIIVSALKPQLSDALKLVNKSLVENQKTVLDLSPKPELVMNAFRLCPWDKIQVVLLGQDPFIKPNEATGLCFSVPRNITTPPSTKSIYKALTTSGLIKTEPKHGDLSEWAKQGVLMLNSALTTTLGASNAHIDAWTKYTDMIIKSISDNLTGIVFILLGNFAQTKATIIDQTKHVIFEWGHPSPMSSYNQKDNPKHFKYCTAFTRTNETLIQLGKKPINWDPDFNLQPDPNPPVDAPFQSNQTAIFSPTTVLEDDPIPPTLGTLWVFTDGGARANGRTECAAGWGVFITDGCTRAVAYDLVEPIYIPDKPYKTSNNRGELTAIIRALEYITILPPDVFSYDNVRIISDSEYSVLGINTRPAEGKANSDLLIRAKELIAMLRSTREVTVERIPHYSHEKAPEDTESEEWFLWKGNDIVDKLCQIPLGEEIKKVKK